MRQYTTALIILIIVLAFPKVYAQPAMLAADMTDSINLTPNAFSAPKREFRGVWVATVVNIDWPSSTRLTPQQQRDELIKLLDIHQRNGINAIVLQVRPAADAFYAKSLEPWSKYLSGQQGKGPYPEYDPLEFAIQEAHKRGMELHAWFNPYRATFDRNFNSLATDHITRLKPEWFFTYGGIKLFNPGLPEVREYITRVILNVVDNYDVDGIHMDDYFYPYPIAGQRINDDAAFKQYGTDFEDIKDWRRNNVDLLIKMLGDSIHHHKAYVKFGISPFGIWANKYQNPEGSETGGGSSYYEQFADSRKWVREGWLDYINPQLYWPIGSRAAAFDKLTEWWSNNTNNRHLYLGQAAYRLLERKTAAFRDPAELPRQIQLIRSNARVQGSVFFSSNSLISNPLGIADSLKQHYYRYPALPPPMLWLDSVAPNAPQNLNVKPSVNGIRLTWTAPVPARDNEPVYGYVIYRFEDGDKIDINNAEKILQIKYNAEAFFEDKTALHGKKYFYVITAIDRLKNESTRSQVLSVSN